MKKLLMVLWLPFLTACANIERLAVPQAIPLPDTTLTRAAPPPGQQVDHSDWTVFLDRYVTTDAEGVNRVAYGKVTQADQSRLAQYLANLQAADPSRLTRNQQLAYWINLYNALTVDVVLENYPVASIRDIKDGPLSIGPWNRPLATIAEQNLTLNDIEHRIIRPTFNEPRIHYALNCAAVGCPNLMARAWEADTLERDLARAERAYVNDPRGVRFDDHERLILSKIYIWFREDFGANEQEVITSISQAAEPELREMLEQGQNVHSYQYDWALNDAAFGS